jgi:hypothetical protein
MWCWNSGTVPRQSDTITSALISGVKLVDRSRTTVILSAQPLARASGIRSSMLGSGSIAMTWPAPYLQARMANTPKAAPRSITVQPGVIARRSASA